MILEILPESAGVNLLVIFLTVSIFVSLSVTIVTQLIGSRTKFRSKTPVGMQSSRFLLSLIFTLSLLGTAVGILSGWSRVGVVGSVIPSVLTLVGALTVYLFDRRRSETVIVSISTITFTICLFIGFLTGNQFRNPSETHLAYRDFCLSALSNPGILNNTEGYCRFLTGAGDQCWSTLFENTAAYKFPEKPLLEKLQIWDDVSRQRVSHERRERGLRLLEQLRPSGANLTFESRSRLG